MQKSTISSIFVILFVVFNRFCFNAFWWLGGPPGIGPLNPRMNPPRGAPIPAGYAPGMRGPPPGMYYSFYVPVLHTPSSGKQTSNILVVIYQYYRCTRYATGHGNGKRRTTTMATKYIHAYELFIIISRKLWCKYLIVWLTWCKPVKWSHVVKTHKLLTHEWVVISLVASHTIINTKQ